MLPSYNDNIDLVYGNFKRLNKSIYNYKIYYYVGDENNNSVEDFFPFEMSDGVSASREEYALKIKKIIDEVFNDKNIGARFEYSDYEDSEDSAFIKVKGEGSITIFRLQGSMATLPNNGWGIKMSLMNNEKDIRATILHELQHCLGLVHTQGRSIGSRYSKDGFTKYGNPYFSYMSFSKSSGELSPESLNALDIVYDNDSVLKITGNINKDFEDMYGDGYAEAFISKFNNEKWRPIHHTVVDSNGYFEFRLRSIPDFKTKYKLLIVSSGINLNFVNLVYDTETDKWFAMNYPEDVLRYGTRLLNELSVPVTSEKSNIRIDNIQMNKKADTLKKLERKNNIVMMVNNL